MGRVAIPVGPLQPWKFPFAGNPLGPQRKQITYTDTVETTIFDSGANTSGVVRTINFPSNTVLSQLATANLRVYYDGSGTPDFDIPLTSLVGAEKITAVDDNVAPITRFFNWPGTWMTTGQVAQYTPLTLKYPMPWTNRLKIAMYSTGGGAQQFWVGVTGQDALPACWNRNLRLHATRHQEVTAGIAHRAGTCKITSAGVAYNVANFAAGDVGKSLTSIGRVTVAHDMLIRVFTDTGHITISSVDNHDILADTSLGVGYNIATHHQFLNLSGELYLVALMAGFTPATDNSYMEGCVRLYAQGSSDACLTSSGLEDFVNKAFYGDTRLAATQAHDAVIVGGNSSQNDYNIARIFYDDCLHASNGLRGTFPIVNTGTCNNAWTAVYYA